MDLVWEVLVTVQWVLLHHLLTADHMVIMADLTTVVLTMAVLTMADLITADLITADLTTVDIIMAVHTITVYLQKVVNLDKHHQWDPVHHSQDSVASETLNSPISHLLPPGV